jgi:hypothetical protein
MQDLAAFGFHVACRKIDSEAKAIPDSLFGFIHLFSEKEGGFFLLQPFSWFLTPNIR